MTREEAIKMLTAKAECMKRDISGMDEDCNSHNCGECNLCYEQGNMGEQIEYLQMAIKALEEPQWIPCSEKLPEEGQIVLATHLGGLDPNRQVIEHIYSGGEFLLNWEMDMELLSPTFGQRYMGEVIAWMPLPEPWKGEWNETD